MGGDDKKKADTTPIETMDTPVETGDGTAGRTNAGTASTAKLKPLYTGDVSRAPWVKIETLMSEAYHLERMAKAIRAKDGDEAFRREIKKALKEFREAQLLFYDWQDEVEALAEGLFDRRFKREDTKFTRLNKTMRKYFQFEK